MMQGSTVVCGQVGMPGSATEAAASVAWVPTHQLLTLQLSLLPPLLLQQQRQQQTTLWKRRRWMQLGFWWVTARG